MNDLMTMIWKEAKELFAQGPRFRGGWLGMLIFLGVFGIMIPVQTGPEWVTSPFILVMWAWVPYILVQSIVADSFAGERERHTLETLLASRLSDRTILFGKLAWALLYGWGMSLVSILIGLIAVNLVHGEGRLLLFPLPIFLGILAVTFLVAGLSAGLGVLVSLRAPSVRQAQQILSYGVFILIIPVMLLPLLPASVQNWVMNGLNRLDPSGLAILVIAILLVVDAVLIGLSMARFRRARLILD